MTRRLPPRPALVAGLVLGAGLGGFVDGVVLHQLLEWHHMLSGRRPLSDPANMAVNMRADGLFHLGCLVLTTGGVLLLGRAPRTGTPTLVGLLLAGWGVFNLVEGTVNHLVLGLHHVRHGPAELAWDLGLPRPRRGARRGRARARDTDGAHGGPRPTRPFRGDRTVRSS